MSGWIPAPADGWDEVAEALSSTGAPWPEAAVIIDLRWHVDRQAAALLRRGVDPTQADLVAGIPGRPTLARRWGWTDWRVKQMLREPLRWWDAHRWGPQDAPEASPPADRQPTASRPPAAPRMERHNQHGTASRPPADRQPTATRAEETPSPSPSQNEKTPQPPAVRGAAPGSTERVEWVRAMALQQLDQEADPGALLRLYRTPTGEYVDRWLQATRGQSVIVQTLDGPRRARRRALPDAPEGLRRREVRDGLALAAADWPGRDPPVGELRLVDDPDCDPWSPP